MDTSAAVAIVLDEPGCADLIAFLEQAAVRLMTAASRVEFGAWRRYGKGSHPAALNYGDSVTYALAERTGSPVLCVGDDFAATDLDVLGPGYPA